MSQASPAPDFSASAASTSAASALAAAERAPCHAEAAERRSSGEGHTERHGGEGPRERGDDDGDGDGSGGGRGTEGGRDREAYSAAGHTLSAPPPAPPTLSPVLSFDASSFLDSFHDSDSELGGTPAAGSGGRARRGGSCTGSESDEDLAMFTPSRPDFRVAALEADCEELRDNLNKSEMDHQELMVKHLGLKIEAKENKLVADDMTERSAELELELQTVRRQAAETTGSLEMELVKCKMELAQAKGAGVVVGGWVLGGGGRGWGWKGVRSVWGRAGGVIPSPSTVFYNVYSAFTVLYSVLTLYGHGAGVF